MIQSGTLCYLVRVRGATKVDAKTGIESPLVRYSELNGRVVEVSGPPTFRSEVFYPVRAAWLVAGFPGCKGFHVAARCLRPISGPPLPAAPTRKLEFA